MPARAASSGNTPPFWTSFVAARTRSAVCRLSRPTESSAPNTPHPLRPPCAAAGSSSYRGRTGPPSSIAYYLVPGFTKACLRISLGYYRIVISESKGGAMPTLQNAPDERLRVLVVTAGHSFVAEPFFPDVRADDGIRWEGVEHPGAWSSFRVDTVGNWDAIVMYDMPGLHFSDGETIHVD